MGGVGPRHKRRVNLLLISHSLDLCLDPGTGFDSENNGRHSTLVLGPNVLICFTVVVFIIIDKMIREGRTRFRGWKKKVKAETGKQLLSVVSL